MIRNYQVQNLKILFSLVIIIPAIAGCTRNGDLPGKNKSKVFVNVPVDLVGEDLHYSYPEDLVCNVEVEGVAEFIDAMKPDDVVLKVNVEEISPGLYENVPVVCEVPNAIKIVGIDPENVDLKVEFASSTKTLDNVPIFIANKNPGLSYIIYPETCNVSLVGPLEVLESMEPSAMQASIDVADLAVGNHIVDITVTVLPDDITAIGTQPGVCLLTITETESD